MQKDAATTPPLARTTRLAPSPTGALHLGNARTFLVNWALARQNRWQIVLRIEDLDGPRVKPGADTQAIDDLAWLGLDWDAGPLYQRADLSPYARALKDMNEKGLIYPCTCTRQEIERAQSAPHGDEHELRYPGTCREKAKLRVSSYKLRVEERAGGAGSVPLVACNSKLETPLPSPTAWRVLAPSLPIIFIDEIHGPQRIDVDAEVGDFVVATKAGLPAYQLAVVVDDARQSVTDVIRGDDLLPSAARQLWLYQVLGFTPLPRYWHLPLVLGPDDRRLAKRHGDSRITWYCQQGVAVERIIGLLARWCGIAGEPRAMTAREFAERFAIDALPRGPVTFTPEDHQWLMQR